MSTPCNRRQIGRSSRVAVAAKREAGAAKLGCDRSRLAALAPLEPLELSRADLDGRLHVLRLLRRALRRERQRGIAGDWTYDLGRHRALAAAVRDEMTACLDLARAQDPLRRR